MRSTIVAGNWKMHLDVAAARTLAGAVSAHVRSAALPPQVGVVLCPPAPLLAAVIDEVRDTSIGVGAQNMHAADSGAYTGESSAGMLLSLGCTHVILGHSERRQYFHESDQLVNGKLLQALRQGLRPIVCIGETLEQRETGITQPVLEIQLRESLAGISAEELRGVILAYEPVWAIGTGRTATPEQAQEAHAFIRSVLADMSDSDTAAHMVIQYGGSVKADNAAELFAQPDVDGGLVGGASLDATAFAAIIDAAR